MIWMILCAVVLIVLLLRIIHLLELIEADLKPKQVQIDVAMADVPEHVRDSLSKARRTDHPPNWR